MNKQLRSSHITDDLFYVNEADLNLLLINYEYPPIGAGAANATWHIARQLNAKGCRISVVTSGYRTLAGKAVEDGITVYRCPALRKYRVGSNLPEMASFVASAAAFLPLLLRKHEYHGAIVFFSIPCGPLGLWGKHLSGIPYVVSLRGGDVPGNESAINMWHRLLQPMRRAILENSLAVVANSHGLKTLSEKADPFPVRVIPSGVDTDFFRPQPKAHPCFRFVFVGRFQAQKNLFFLLEQARILKESTRAPFELHLVGDGQQRHRLRSYVQSLNMDETVVWHSWCDKSELLAHYHHADCLVNPSFNEGLPNSVLEAMACGVPVIASRVVGQSSLVEDGHAGLLFDLDQPRSFQQAAELILRDPALGRRLGMNGRARVERDFSWERVAGQYLHLFDRGVKQSRSIQEQNP